MLAVNNLTFKYNQKSNVAALDDVSFSLKDGEKIALIGANGAGKSTLLLSLVGVLKQSEGSIVLSHDENDAPDHSHSGALLTHMHETLVVDKDHHDRKTIAQLRSHVGMLFQNPDDQIFMPLVKEDIAFGPSNYKLDKEETDRRMDEILEKLSITRLKERLSNQLSDGEKRLVGLAGILIMDPFILLLDEPYTFLDRKAQRNLTDILASLDHTLILATHDFHHAKVLCERTILISGGKVAADGPTNEILDNEELLRSCGL